MSVVGPTVRQAASIRLISVQFQGHALNSRSPRWRRTLGFGPKDRRFDSDREDLEVRSSVARTPRLHRGSQRFNSSRTYMRSWGSSSILLASRASDGSSNLSDLTMPAWPNWIRQLVSNQPSTGSSPVAGVRRRSREVTRRTADPEAAGSIPAAVLMRGGSQVWEGTPLKTGRPLVQIRPSLIRRLQLPRGRKRGCRPRRSEFEARGADCRDSLIQIRLVPCDGTDAGAKSRSRPSPRSCGDQNNRTKRQSIGHMPHLGLVAQSGRAFSLRGNGHRFKSGRVH